MKYKKIMMLAILLVTLFTISAVSAVDNSTGNVVGIEETTNEVVRVEENNMGTLTQLANEIANAADEFNLTRNYAYAADDLGYINGITIDKKIAINGNGHIIDGNNQARIFNVTASNVIISNISFVKCGHNNGAALHWGYSGENGILFACSFVNCSDCAVIWRSDYGVLSDCTFINCTSNSGPGAISWDSHYSVLANCTFTDCNSQDSSRDRGGAIKWLAYNSVVVNCSFENCYSSNVGGAFYSDSDLSGDCILANCSFVECSANGNGGAIYWGCSYSVLANCSFEKCSSRKGDGGAIYCDSYSLETFYNCSFNECSAYENGGAIHNTRYNIIISNCSIVNCNATIGGGIYSSSTTISIINSTFEGNSAQNGSDWYSIYAINVINITPNCTILTVLDTTEDINMMYGESKNLIVTLSDVNNNLLVGYPITISLNNVSYTKTTDNSGQVSLDIPTSLLPGSYVANISYLGNAEQLAHISNAGLTEYMPITTTADVNISKGKTVISCDDVSADYNDNISLVVTLTNEASGKAITNAKVVVNLNGVDYNVKTDSKGRAKVSANGLAPDNYVATISYLGNTKYTPANATARVTVNGDFATFADLATEIANAEGELNLIRDYKYLPNRDSAYKDGIIIDKSITINGNGHTINANNQARIFDITASDVTIKNIDFVEGSHNNGGAIYWEGSNGALTNCSFVNCSAISSSTYPVFSKSCGGAVYWKGSNGALTNCDFINCSASSNFGSSNGGAVYWDGPNGVLTDCSFINCSIFSSYRYYIFSCGGAVYWCGSNGVLTNCSFVKCSAISSSTYQDGSKSCGGAVYWRGSNGVLTNCSFVKCSAISSSTYQDGSVYGASSGSGYLLGDSDVHPYGCSYGGAVYWEGSNGVLTNCSFVNCSAISSYTLSYGYSYGCGGAVFWNGEYGALANCSFEKCSASSISHSSHGDSSSYGGAVFWGCELDFDDDYPYHGINGVLANSSFVDCSVIFTGSWIDSEGGAISWIAYGGTLINCNFINCRAEKSDKSGSTSKSSDWYSGDYQLKVIMSTAIDASDVSVAYGDSVKLIATLTDFNNTPLAEQPISIVLNNVEYALKTNSKGEASFAIPTNLAPNTYTATISYAGNEEYAPSSTTANVAVNKMDVDIVAEYNNETSELIASLTNVNTGKAISGAKVVVNINGVDNTVKTNSKGQVKLSTADLPLGTYAATVSYNGNSKYNPASTSIDIVIKTNIIISAFYDADNNEIVATLTNEATGKAVSGAKVQVEINGATTTVKTNSKGQVKVSTADLPLGTYTATVSYNGNSKYNPASTSISVDLRTKVIITDVYGYSDKLVATLTNGATGNPIVNAYMQVEINGVIKTAKSNSKSQISIDTSDLGLTKYDVTISYGGNSRYTPSSATVAIDLNKANMNIKYSYNADTKELVATLKNSKTGKVVSNAKMVVDINGVKTTLKSNNKGQIIFSTADFAPGTHVGTITYGGNDRYNSISAAFKVDV